MAFVMKDITAEMVTIAPNMWKDVMGVGLKFGLDSKIARLIEDKTSYELAADRWEFIFIEMPKKKNEIVNLLCLIATNHRPDEMSVTKIGRKEYLSLWWD